ncbi:MAG: efflux RND transporter periplasmic adaptor subunit [Planctomycetota bacterium]
MTKETDMGQSKIIPWAQASRAGTMLFCLAAMGGLAFWLIGSLRSGGMAEAEAQCDAGPCEGGGHAEKQETGLDGLGNLDPVEIEKRECEHNIRQIECQPCRFELGVVKVDPSVTDALARTVVVQEGVLAQILRLTGEVQFDQTGVVDVVPICPGRVISVNARLGERVQQGEILAVIHSGEFGEAKAVFLEAQTAADIAAREKERQSAVGAALEKLLEGLSKGDPNIHISGAPLGEWKSKVVGAFTRLEQARAVHAREIELVARQASSRAELEAAERELDSAQADYAALTEEVQLNRYLDRLKAENASRSADARLAAAEQRLHLFGLDHAAIRSLGHAQENGRFTQLEIRAPRNGVIIAQNITEGQYVEAAQNLYMIADTSSLWVWCDLYERDLAALHGIMAQGGKPRARVKVAAYGEPLIGTLDLLGSVVDENSRTIKVRISLKDEQGRFKPGMFATVAVELPGGGKATLVPQGALLNDADLKFVFIHWKDDLWLRRNVATGRMQDDMVEILAGLEPGARVVTGGGFLFKSDVLRAKMGAGCAD